MKHACKAIWMMAGILTATPRYVGMVMADGRLWVDNAGVSNHATIFEGSVVATEEVPAKLQLTGGVLIWLDAASRADVFQDRLVLEKGSAQLDSGSAFRIEARTLRVSLASPESRALVRMEDSGAVKVGALNGEVQVRNRQDVLVARIESGRSLDLRPDAAAAFLVTGCVWKSGKSLVLQDEVSGVRVELLGDGLSACVGKRIQVTGTAVERRATTAADQVIQADTFKVLETGCAAPAGAAAASAPGRAAPTGSGTAGAAGGASAGLSAPMAVVVGVAVAAGSTALAHIVTAQKKKSPISGGR